MTTSRLRIGLLLNEDHVGEWAQRLIEMINASHYAEICVAVVAQHPPPAPRRAPGFFDKFRGGFGLFFRRAIAGMLQAFYRKVLESPYQNAGVEKPVALLGLLPDVPVVRVSPIRRRWTDTIVAGDLKALDGYRVDVYIRLGFRILAGGILRSATYGVWSLHHGDNRINRGGPPGFWESMQAWPETGTVLQILSADLDNGKVLYRSFSCTDSISTTHNHAQASWKSLSFIPRTLKELYELGPDEFFSRVDAQNREPAFYSQRLYRKPDNRQLAKLLVRKAAKKALLMYHGWRYLDQWILLFDLRSTFSSSLWRYRRMLPPMDRFWADPHVIQQSDHYIIFIEEFLYATQRGHLSVIVMQADGSHAAPVPIVQRPYHLSHPFVFQYEGAHYLIPESAGNATLELYRATNFPLHWEFHGLMMENIRAYDATVVFHNGKWWLFANVTEDPRASSWDELHLFYADSPIAKDWLPHPRNPIVSDCKSSRPAGSIFEMHGRLYRPSQNSSVRYGYGFNLSRIDVLDEQDYREEIVTRVTPDWADDVLATHTYNRVGRLHVIDAQVRRKR